MPVLLSGRCWWCWRASPVRGIRAGPASLVAVLGVAVVATLAGAANYRELGLVAVGPPQELLFLLGARWDLAGLVFIELSAGTLPRLLSALDVDELDRAGERGCASTPTVTPAAGHRAGWQGPGRATAHLEIALAIARACLSPSARRAARSSWVAARLCVALRHRHAWRSHCYESHYGHLQTALALVSQRWVRRALRSWAGAARERILE
jgi:hypothetical protein